MTLVTKFNLGVPLRVGLSAPSPRPACLSGRARLWAFRYYPSPKASDCKAVVPIKYPVNPLKK